jgi:hypothetical protein
MCGQATIVMLKRATRITGFVSVSLAILALSTGCAFLQQLNEVRTLENELTQLYEAGKYDEAITPAQRSF